MRIDDGGLKQTIRLQKAQTDMAKTVFERQEDAERTDWL